MTRYRPRNRLLAAGTGAALMILGVSVFLTGRLSHAVYGPLADYGEERHFFGVVFFAGGASFAWLALRRP